MRKLIATFYYQGSASELIYRRVAVLGINTDGMNVRKLSGFEQIRDNVTHTDSTVEYKTYRLEDCSGLRIRFISEPDPKPTTSVSDQLRDLADQLEKGSK